MTLLFILNDPPYGTERTYNGPRLALNLKRTQGGAEKESVTLRARRKELCETCLKFAVVVLVVSAFLGFRA